MGSVEGWCGWCGGCLCNRELYECAGRWVRVARVQTSTQQPAHGVRLLLFDGGFFSRSGHSTASLCCDG